MDSSCTTVAVQRYLDELAGVCGDDAAEPVVRALMARSVDRLHILCEALLNRGYPRLKRGPLNLQSDELLGAVVERLLKAMRQIRPTTVRQFFALANQHIRWELNDLARRLDRQPDTIQLQEAMVASPSPIDRCSSSSSSAGLNTCRILAAIDALPADEREAFNLVRIQGMSPADVAEVIGVTTRTVQRRLNRGLSLLERQLDDLLPATPPSDVPLERSSGAMLA